MQVPANRIGSTTILHVVITLSVFVPFALFCMRQGLDWNFLWAGVCLLGAVYFMFR